MYSSGSLSTIGTPVTCSRLVGDELQRDPVTDVQPDEAPEVAEAFVLLFAHVLVVRLPGGVDALPPAR